MSKSLLKVHEWEDITGTLDHAKAIVFSIDLLWGKSDWGKGPCLGLKNTALGI